MSQSLSKFADHLPKCTPKVDFVNAFSSVSLFNFLWNFSFVILMSSGVGWWYIYLLLKFFLWLSFRSNSHFSFLVIIIHYDLKALCVAVFFCFVLFFCCSPTWLYSIFIVVRCISLWGFSCSVMSTSWRASVMATDGTWGFSAGLWNNFIVYFIAMFSDSCSSRWSHGGYPSESLPWNAKDLFSSP